MGDVIDMLAAIYLDDQHGVYAEEVGDKRTGPDLTTELAIAEATASKVIPQPVFRVGRVAS
jgi:hypothetical protein